MEHTKILIVEDEILIAEDLKDTLNSLGFAQIEMAHDHEAAMKLIDSFQPQITLLDIRLEHETDGLKIGDHLSKNKLSQFIYVTAHSDVEMVRQIVKTNPAGYITKPVKKSDLYASICLVLEQARTSQLKSQTVQIRDGYDTVMVDINKIKYVEAEGNYLNIFCDDKKYVVRQSMDSFIEDANSPLLYKIHRSYTVNINKIIRFSKKEITIGEETLPVSRNIKDDFETFMSQLGKK